MKSVAVPSLALCMALCMGSIACNGGKSNPAAEAPPPLKVEKVQDRNEFQVDQPEKYQLTQAVEHFAEGVAPLPGVLGQERQVRRDQRPFVITHITRVGFPVYRSHTVTKPDRLVHNRL